MISLETILKKIDYLPPFPASVTKVLRKLKDPNVTAEEIAETVKFDPALTTNVLRLCNSSYFGLRRTINNLREAIVYIGLTEIKKVIVRSGTRKYFEKRRPGYEAEQGEMWRHAIAVSIIADNLQRRIDGTNKDYTFIAALLHDIGKLVLSEFVEDASREILALVDQEEISFLDAEKRVLGISHADVGGRILEHWEFPEEIVSAVRKHHLHYEEGDTAIDNIVRLADTLAMIMGYETSVDGLAYPGFSDLSRMYGFKRDEIDVIIADSLEEILKVESEYGVPKEV